MEHSLPVPVGRLLTPPTPPQDVSPMGSVLVLFPLLSWLSLLSLGDLICAYAADVTPLSPTPDLRIGCLHSALAPDTHQLITASPLRPWPDSMAVPSEKGVTMTQLLKLGGAWSPLLVKDNDNNNSTVIHGFL